MYGYLFDFTCVIFVYSWEYMATKMDMTSLPDNPELFWLSGNRTFGLFMINHHKRREVHAKEASQLQL